MSKAVMTLGGESFDLEDFSIGFDSGKFLRGAERAIDPIVGTYAAEVPPFGFALNEACERAMAELTKEIARCAPLGGATVEFLSTPFDPREDRFDFTVRARVHYGHPYMLFHATLEDDCEADPSGHRWLLNGSRREIDLRADEVAAFAGWKRVTLRRCVKCGAER